LYIFLFFIYIVITF